MKNFIIILVLAFVGAGAAYGYLRWNANRKPQPTNSQTKQAADDHDGHDHSAGDGHDHAAEGETHLHGDTNVPTGTALCSKHRVPERVDAFCHPELVEKLGQCAEHGVPEAFCTRCSPVLIAAFKAEGDWCAEHSVPESQCTICKGG